MQNDKKPTYQELSKITKSIITSLKELQNNPGWEKVNDNTCDLYKMGLDNHIASKGVAIVNYPMKTICKFLDFVGSLMKLDQNCIEEKLLEMMKDIQIVYYRFKAPWPISHRDFVTVSYTFQEGNNRIYIGSKSCNYPFGQIQGVVRGEVFIGGYILEKINQNQTRVTYMSSGDIKGLIPGLIKNQLAKKQGQIAGRVQQTMKNEKI